MDAMHSVSESGGPYVLGFKASRSARYASVFKDSDYTRALNHLLQLELGTVALYRHCYRSWPAALQDLRIDEQHQSAARHLVNLIVANRGIPNKDGVALPAEISILISRLTLHFGHRIRQQASRRVCMQMEKMLRRRYHAALDLAPQRDHSCLVHLIYCTKKNMEQIEAFSH
ncbi:MAG: hypothetical protein ACOH5I_11455 [Oligoflexus sp.]